MFPGELRELQTLDTSITTCLESTLAVFARKCAGQVNAEVKGCHLRVLTS